MSHVYSSIVDAAWQECNVSLYTVMPQYVSPQDNKRVSYKNRRWLHHIPAHRRLLGWVEMRQEQKWTCGLLTDWLHVQFWQSSSFTLHVCFSETDILPVIRFKEKHYKKVKIQRMGAEECPVAAGADVDGEFLIFI